MNRFPVGGRVLKTVLAVTLAIFLAQQLGLKNVGLAAVLAVLAVQRTFYRSLVQGLSVVGTVFLGCILGGLCGYLLGTTPLSYGLATLFSILICLQLHWQDNVVLTTVTAVTVIFSDIANLTVFLEQLAPALLGAVCALAINYLFTPNHEEEVVQRLLAVEEGLRRVVDGIIQKMLKPGPDNGVIIEEIKRLAAEIHKGKAMAKLLREEQRFIITRETPSDRYRQAFHIFDSQLDRLEEMYKLARRMPVEVPQAVPLVKLFRIVQKVQYNRLRGKSWPANLLERAMENLDQRYDTMELPLTRAEFVSRASLFHLFREIRRFYRRTLKLPVVVPRKISRKTFFNRLRNRVTPKIG